MILEKIKKNKLILGLLLGIVIVGGVFYFVLIEREKIKPPIVEDPRPQWLDRVFTRLEAEVTGINIIENYLMVKPLSPPMKQEIKVKINPETIIEKRGKIKEKTIKDIENGHFISLSSREDVREKTKITQLRWFMTRPPLDEPLDIVELPAGEEQWWLEHPIFNLTGEVVEVNLEENYLRIRPVFPPLEQEMRVILGPDFTFESVEMVTTTIDDIGVEYFIAFKIFETTGEDIRKKQVIEKVIGIQVFGDIF